MIGMNDKVIFKDPSISNLIYTVTDRIGFGPFAKNNLIGFNDQPKIVFQNNINNKDLIKLKSEDVFLITKNYVSIDDIREKYFRSDKK